MLVVVLTLPAVLSASCLYGYLSEKNKAIPYMPNLGFCLEIVFILMFENEGLNCGAVHLFAMTT